MNTQRPPWSGRWRHRYEERGYDGLFDRRRGGPWHGSRRGSRRGTSASSRSLHGADDCLLAALRDFILVLFQAGDNPSPALRHIGAEPLHVGCTRRAGVCRGLRWHGLRG